MMKENDDIKEKLGSKLWKTRQQGLKELHEIIEKNPSLVNISFREWAKYLNDSNLQTQEQAFLAFKFFCMNNKGRFEFDEGMESVIKALLSVSSKEILVVGLECCEEIFIKKTKEFLLTVNKILLLKSNNLISVLMGFLKELLVLYGPKSLGFDLLIENLCALLKENSIKSNVKGKIVAFYKESFKFLGNEEIQKYLIKLKKPFLKELEEFIQKNPCSELKKPTKNLEIEVTNEESPKEKSSKLMIFNENWINEVLNAKKNWQNKTEMLEEFLISINNLPKTHFESISSQLNVMLRRLLNDSNINIVIVSIKIIEKIYVNFSKEATIYAKGLMQLLMDKFKEKRLNVVEETHKALDSLRKSLNIEEHSLQTYFYEVFENKNHNYRLNALIFLNKMVTNSNVEALVPLIKRALDDQIQEIRDMAVANLKDLYANFSEKRLKPLISDLPSAKLLQIMNKTFENETSIINHTLLTSSILHNKSENQGNNTKNDGVVENLLEKINKKLPNELFVVQELEFLRMSKKMRVFQIENKKISENDLKSNLVIMKIQFTQVFARNFRDMLFDIDDKMVFLETLIVLYANINYFLERNIEEKTIRDGLMKFETVSDLIIKYLVCIYKEIFSLNEENLIFESCLWILRIFQAIVKVLAQLKQSFLEFEVKFLLNLSVLTFHSTKYHMKFEEEIFKMLENLTVLSLNSNKMTEFFLEEFRNSEPKAWGFRDQIIRLISMILIPKLMYFPLQLLHDYWEIISNRKIITAYKTKYCDLSLLPQFSSEFYEYLLIKDNIENVLSNENYKGLVLGTVIQPECFDFCLDTMRNSPNFHEKIDCLLLLNDMATSEFHQSHLLFQEKTPKFLITFLITLRETLIEKKTSAQFTHFFLNYLQKFLAAGLLNMSHPFLICLAEEIFFVLVRNENENIAKLLNLCVMRILEFADIKIIMLGIWNLLVKYSKFPCYYLIYSLVNLSLLKVLKRMKNENFPFQELIIGINQFIKQSKKLANQEDVCIKTMKCIIYQIIQIKGIEIFKLIEGMSDISDILVRWINAISRPFLPNIDINKNFSEEEKKIVEEQIKELANKLKCVDGDFDEIVIKLIEICEMGFYNDVILSIDQFEHDNLKNYLKLSLERVLFIRQFPFVAQENKIFHKKLEKKPGNLVINDPSNRKKCYDYRSKLSDIFREQNSKEMNGTNNINNNFYNNNTSNFMKNDEKTEENLINMLQQIEEDYLDHPGLEDLCNPFSSKELFEEENLINFDQEFSSFTYCDDNIINVDTNPKEKNLILPISEPDINKIDEGCLDEIESIVSQQPGNEEFKLTEIPEYEEFEES